jgi:hypothetical protein
MRDIVILFVYVIVTRSRGSGGHSAGILVSRGFGKHPLDFNESVQWLGRPDVNGFD